MKRKTRIIEWHKLREIDGDLHSYENSLSTNEDGEVNENIRANPDRLLDGQQVWGHSEMTRAQELMGEAIAHLHGRQKEVYELVMRDGKSHTEAGKILGVSRDTVKDHKERAIKFITAYCQNVLAKEAINEDL